MAKIRIITKRTYAIARVKKMPVLRALAFDLVLKSIIKPGSLLLWKESRLLPVQELLQ
jgi:hypothetical protein